MKTRNVEQTEALLQKVFERHQLGAEWRKLDLAEEKGEVGTIRYFVSISPAISTDQLSHEIIAADADAVESIEWEQKRSGAYLYR